MVKFFCLLPELCLLTSCLSVLGWHQSCCNTPPKFSAELMLIRGAQDYSDTCFYQDENSCLQSSQSCNSSCNAVGAACGQYVDSSYYWPDVQGDADYSYWIIDGYVYFGKNCANYEEWTCYSFSDCECEYSDGLGYQCVTVGEEKEFVVVAWKVCDEYCDWGN